MYARPTRRRTVRRPSISIAWTAVVLAAGGQIACIAAPPDEDSAPAMAQVFPRELSPPTGRALQIEDYYRIKSIRGPQISPDGRWVAYSVATPNEDDNGDLVATWVVGAAGAQAPLHVSHGDDEVTDPGWTDASTLRYSAAAATWTLDPADPSAGPVLLASAPAEDAASEPPRDPVSESADGTWLALLEEVPYPVEERAPVSDFVRRHEERFEGVQFDWMYFQRDGQEFPVPDPRIRPAQEIAVAPADGSVPPQRITNLGLRPSNIAWRADNRMLVFTADEHFRDESSYGRPDLFVASIDGDVERLTDDGYTYGNTAFSPDGRYISYVRGFGTDMIIAERLEHGGSRDLFIRPVTGGEPINLTADWDLDPQSPRWAPEGGHIYFTAAIAGGAHLFRVAAAGGDVEQVTDGERRIGNLSFDRDFRTIAYTVGQIDAPAEVWVANIDGSEQRRVTGVHDALLEEISFSGAERLLFDSYDGTPVEGWLLYPYDYRPERGPYPLIVNSHGGPHSASGYSFNFKQQYFAANGYFVLQTNFRSSTGYGDDFKWATWGAWGDKDGEDVMSGVDYALEHFAIDPDRVGVTGHSYGGFMSNWLITQYPDRIAAAVVGAGISNWVSDYGTADIARTKETEFFGTPWEEEGRRRLIRQSPLTYAGRVRAPTLFVHGELDQRVPYAEAEQMYFAIKKQGVPAKMIRYAGMAHGIRGHWNVVHRAISELAWWERWLKPGGDAATNNG